MVLRQVNLFAKNRKIAKDIFLAKYPQNKIYDVTKAGNGYYRVTGVSKNFKNKYIK